MSTSYANPGGTGNRHRLIVPTTSLSLVMHFLIDGTADNVTFSGGSASGATIAFDFGNRHIIDEAKWYQSAAGSPNHGTWKWQGSDDGSSWTDIGSSFTLGGSTVQTQTTLSGNTTYYRHYRLLGVSGSFSFDPYIQQIEFKISDPYVAYPDGVAWVTGDRTSSITITKSGFSITGSLTQMIDGSNADSFGFGGGAAAAGHWFQFDFGSPLILDGCVWRQNVQASHGEWKWQGSNDGSSWSDIGVSFTLAGNVFPDSGSSSIFPELAPNRTAYRYYRLLGVSGSYSGGPYIREVEFRQAAAPAGGGLLPAWLFPNKVIDMYRKNTAGQNLAFVLLDAATGGALTGATVTGYRSIDGGTQAAVTGTISEKANGQYNLALSAADCNGNQIGFLFVATGAIPVHVAIVTTADDPTTGTAAAVWGYATETGWTAVEAMRVMLASLAGKVSGANSTAITFRDVGDTKDRIEASVDQYGNRTAVTYDKT